MRETVIHPTYGEIVYEEGFWSGKKSITVNGTRALSTSKKTFILNGQTMVISGNFYTGINLIINGESIVLSPKPKWYEVVLSVIPVLFLLTWGNVPELCAIFPVVGGGIGGAIGAVFSLSSLSLMKKAQSPLRKVIIGVGMIAVTLLVAFLLAIMLISALA